MDNHSAHLRYEALDTASFQDAAQLFKHLSDPTRVRLFWLLCHREECVLQLADLLKMSSPAVSHHLRPLRAAGLLTTRREGKEVYYHAADTTEAQLLHKMIEQVLAITCPE